MALNDAEIKIGVSLDADQFKNAYGNLLSRTSQTTQNYITHALDPAQMKGPAAKNWDTLPFAKMHDPKAGNIAASQAFMSSFAEDMRLAGIRKNSLGWQSGLLSAAYKSSVPDPMERYHKLLSEGVAYYQADEVYPTTALSKMIETDYALMEQDWSRDFIKTRSRKGVKSQYIDFAGMREYAVEHGLGKWKDEDGEHTADNFELIDKELKKIDKDSGNIGKTFGEWGENLKGALGTLTALGSLLVKLGVTAASIAITAAVKSEKETIEAATTLDKRRAYVGMSALDELSAQVAGQAVGLGKDAVTNEIINLSSNREKYQLLGEGLNALYPSLTGIFDNIMSSENPMDTYKSILKEVYNNMRGADQDTRAQTLMLLESQGLGSAAQIIGAMLSNEGVAKELGYDPTNLFSLRNNKYYGVYERAETMLPDLTKLDESIQTSYKQLFTDFTEYFGKPFKEWWDKVLQDKVIPWFEKFIHYTHRSDAEKAVSDVNQIITSPLSTLERDELIETKSAYAYVSNYKVPKQVAPTESWNVWLGGDMSTKGSWSAVRNQWDLYERIAKTTDKDIEKWNLGDKGTKAAIKYRDRIQEIVDTMKDTGLSSFLTNKSLDDVDKYFLEAMQLYAAGSWSTDAFNSYIDKVLSIGATNGEVDDMILEQLKKIAENTEGKDTLLSDAAFWRNAERLYGKTTADDWKESINRM